MTNIFQQLANYTVIVFSMSTLAGILLHDTGIDKAVSSAMHKAQTNDVNNEPARVRSGSNLHPHAEHLTVKKDARNQNMLPKKRASKQLAEHSESKHLHGCGFHGEDVCLPLAGEWV